MSFNKIAVETAYGTAELTEAVTDIRIPEASREYTFVQLTDLHIACSESGDPEEAVGLARARNEFWAIQAGFFAHTEGDTGEGRRIMPVEACELVAQRIRHLSPDGVFFTGDTVDYPSGANFRRAGALIGSLGCDCLTVAGNHDTVSEDSDEDTRRAFDILMGGLPRQYAREFDGFDILGFADGFVSVTAEQVAFLRERLCLGRPVIILLHAPVFTEATREKVWPMWGYNWMLGDTGKPEGKQTAENFEFCELLRENRRLVRAVIAGHVHTASGDGAEPEGEVAQYTSAPAFTGFYRVINIRR